MSEVNKKIDQYIRAKRRKEILSACIALAIVVPIFVWFMFPSVGTVKDVEGSITQFVLVPTDYGDRQYMLVKLTNGQIVKVKVYNNLPLKVGDKIVVQRQEPRYFGKTIYRYKTSI